MVNKLINSRLGVVFSTDPAVGLHTWLESMWTTSTGYTVPTAATIKFDVKFGEVKGFTYYVIVENMPVSVKPQILGGTRFTYEDVKRIQILCVGPTARTKKWNMERHIDSIINGNITGMQATYGINEISISDFRDIPTAETEAKITGLQPNTGYQKARSSALVTMRYEQETATV